MNRPYHIGSSVFHVECRSNSWWVMENWTELDRRGEKDDVWEAFGPFPCPEDAEADKARRETP